MQTWHLIACMHACMHIVCQSTMIQKNFAGEIFHFWKNLTAMRWTMQTPHRCHCLKTMTLIKCVDLVQQAFHKKDPFSCLCIVSFGGPPQATKSFGQHAQSQGHPPQLDVTHPCPTWHFSLCVFPLTLNFLCLVPDARVFHESF